MSRSHCLVQILGRIQLQTRCFMKNKLMKINLVVKIRSIKKSICNVSCSVLQSNVCPISVLISGIVPEGSQPPVRKSS